MQFMGEMAPSNIPDYNTDFYEQLHDAILRTEDGSTYKIHRFLLAKRSEYFRALFTCDGNNKTDILIREITGQTLQQILQYLYEGTLLLSEQTLLDIMIASDWMLLDDLMQQCREFAIRRMTTSDCLQLLAIAARHERLNIFRECSRYAKVHFERIIENFPEKIADLPIEVFTELLKDNSLNVASEDTVGTAIDVWLQADLIKRNQHIPDLLNCIRFKEDKPPKTKRPKKVIGISNPFCIESNSSSVAHSSHSSSAPSFLQMILYRETALRFPKYLHVVIKCLRCTCQSGRGIEIYLTYDEELDFWRKFGDAPNVTPDVIVPIGKYVYLFVTEEGVIQRYGLLDGSLITLTEIENRDYYCIVELHNKIYALGGITDPSQNIDTVECYDPDSERWNRLRSVGAKILDVAVAMCGKIYALGHSSILDILTDLEETLYEVGDIDNEDDLEDDDLDEVGNIDNLDDLDDLEEIGDLDRPDDLEETDNPLVIKWMRVYDPISDTWNTVEPPRVFRPQSSAVVFENRLYLTGAENNSLSFKCVEEYDPVLDVWTRLPELPFPYHIPKAQVVAGRLIVFENFYEHNYIECTCPVIPAVCWDGVTRAWQIADTEFYSSVERYRFGILDDPAVIRAVVNRGRSSAVQWDRIRLSE